MPSNKEYYNKNRETLLEKKRQFYLDNRARLLKESKEYYLLHKEQFKERARKRYTKVGYKEQIHRLYCLSSEEYERSIKEQNYKCKICKRANSTGKRLAIDHCHRTGKVRGLLCEKCNHGLGKFEDNISFLKEAIKYLETSNV